MFTIIEGPNGVGKTSIINYLKEKGYDTLSSPNGTPLAQLLRPVCRGTNPWQDVDKTVQFLTFSAARLDEYIRRIHNQDHIIVCDRWWMSTYVYQCILQGLDPKFLEYTIHPEEKIDLVVILTGEPEILIERVEKERSLNPTHGKCSWTKEHETMKKIGDIYQNELPKYLDEKNIEYVIIDTTDINIEAVQTLVESHILITKKQKTNIKK